MAAAFAAAATGFGLSVLRPPPPSSTEILAAARDLPAGTVLRPQDLRSVALPAGLTPDGSIGVGTPTGGRVTGRVISGPMRRGEPLTDARLLQGGLLKGYGDDAVATPIRLSDAGVARLLRPGDRVDVFVVGEPSGDLTEDTVANTSVDMPTNQVNTTNILGAPPVESHPAHSDPGGPDPGEPAHGQPTPDGLRPDDLPADLLPPGRARLLAAAVSVITVPRPQEGLDTEAGALIVLATDRPQAAALAGAQGHLSITVVSVP